MFNTSQIQILLSGFVNTSLPQQHVIFLQISLKQHTGHRQMPVCVTDVIHELLLKTFTLLESCVKILKQTLKEKKVEDKGITVLVG